MMKKIVALLNCEHLKSSTGKSFTVSMIRWIRYKHSHPEQVASCRSAQCQPSFVRDTA